ncbi:hypothetical protein EV361DRAFT_897299 [Lentinula raphanica]|nr:hypothetical protein EV361DRAFT_897299 [Lentinula raphanica]
MPAFNRAYLSLYFFMFFLVSGSELLPKDPKPTSPAGVTVPTGLPDDLYNRLRQSMFSVLGTYDDNDIDTSILM